MAKQKNPNVLALEGADLVFMGGRVKISNLITRAASGGGNELGLPRIAARVPRLAWLSILGADEGVIAAQAAAAMTDMGPALVAALRRLAAAAPAAERFAAALAAGEAARVLLLLRYTGTRGAGLERKARMLAELSRPVTLEATATDTARLAGGPFGRLGVTLRMHGNSRLDWAGQTWALALAAHTPTSTATATKLPAPGRIDDLPVVVTVDGVVVAAESLGAAELVDLLGRAEAGETILPHTGDEDAFIATATRTRDEGGRLGGELHDLESIAAAGGTHLPGVDPEDMTHARWLANVLCRGSASAPRLFALRVIVAAALAPPATGPGSRSARYPTETERKTAWVRALAADARAETEAAADVIEAAIVDEWLASPPGVCGLLLAPGAPYPEDPWQATVVRSVVAAELHDLGERLTRPGPLARASAIRETVMPERSRLPAEVAALVDDARDLLAGIRVLVHPNGRTEAATRSLLAAAWGPEGQLGPGEIAVAVPCATPASGGYLRAWRVLVGRLPAFAVAGLLGEIAANVDGLPVAEWTPYGPPSREGLLHAATAWAVDQWTEAGFEGPPPSCADAVRAVVEAGKQPTLSKRRR